MTSMACSTFFSCTMSRLSMGFVLSDSISSDQLVESRNPYFSMSL